MKRFFRRWVLWPAFMLLGVLFVTTTLLLLHVSKDAVLEERGIKADVTVLGADHQVGRRQSSGYQVDYEFDVKGVTINGDSYVPEGKLEKISVGDRLEAIYDPLKPSRSKLALSMPEDDGHPYLQVLRDAKSTAQSLAVALLLTAACGLWTERRRDPSGLDRRP